MNPPKPFKEEDIVEIITAERVEDGGQVKRWRQRKPRRRLPKPLHIANGRTYILGLITLPWAVCTLVGLIKFIMVGDISLIVYSPTVLIIPHEILKYYFTQEEEG